MEQEIQLTEEQIESVIHSAYEFMNSVIGVYGQDKGVELFQKISDSVDPDIYRTMIIKMISGDGSLGRTITVTGYGTTVLQTSSSSGFVEAIKAVRTVTGFGLKEAKDFMDEVRDRGKNVITLPKGSNRAQALRQLTMAGVIAR